MEDSQHRREMISRIYDQGREAVIEYFERLLIEMQEVSRRQEERIKALENQVSKDSHNSNKPPSSDGLQRTPKSLRVKSDRPSGGQQGHPGTTLKMVATPDHVVVHPVHRCRRCGHSLEQVAAAGHEKRQVFDLPRLRVEVTEHQVEIKNCSHCGIATTSAFPDSVSKASQYGDYVKAFSIYLMQQHLVPFKRTTELLHDLFGCTITEGSLHNWTQQAYRTLQPAEEAVKEQLRQAPVVNADETGIFCEHKLQWLHAASTPKFTHYALHEKRGNEATDAIGILPQFKGRLIHDFWESYLKYENCLHGFCNIHIIRELTAVVEYDHQRWAQELIDLLRHINKYAQRAMELKEVLHPRTILRYLQQYDAIVQRGLRRNPRDRGSPHKRGRKKQSKARNLLERLREYRDGILAFMHDAQVPFTNNLAERDIRMTKVKQKISGTFRSRVGADGFCRIRGYISTVKKNGLNVFDALVNAFTGNPFIPMTIYAE